MSFSSITKNSGDKIISSDMSQLMTNIKLLGGNGDAQPSSDIQSLHSLLSPIVNIATSTGTLTTNSVHLISSSTAAVLTLPSTASKGDYIVIVDTNGYKYKIKPASNQVISYRHIKTVPGNVNNSYVQSHMAYASTKLVCTVANTNWEAVDIYDIYYGKGYYGGGTTGSKTAVIEDMDFTYESSNIIAATLNTAKISATTTCSNTKGYFMGGDTGSLTDVIEDMNFSDETSSPIIATLNTAKTAGAGVSGNAKGYYMGGNDASNPVATIEDMNFSDESSSVIVATIDTTTFGPRGLSGISKGYCMGGWYSSRIEDMNFSTETSTLLAETLKTSVWGMGMVSCSTKGFAVGGNTGFLGLAPQSGIDRFTFSTEVCAAIVATLDTAKSGQSGTSAMKKGYIAGGNTDSGGGAAYVAVIEDMDFTYESSNVISATLNTAKETLEGTQGCI